jgi:universal stress protein A
MSSDLAPLARKGHEIRARRVLVATDLGEASSGALRLGAEVARAFDAELLIVHVLPDLDIRGSVKDVLGMEPGDLLERRAGEAERRLRQLESMLGRGHVHASVRCGSAAAEIVRLANEAAVDFIVVGSHGPTCPRGMGMEPVAERVRARARCPVIVALPPVDTGPAGGPAPGSSIHRVLVATDLTSRSSAAVQWGRVLGERLGCPVHVLHVIGARGPRRKAPAGAGAPDIIRVGQPAQQIVSCARELGADLIVLGPPRRGVWPAALLGDVGRAVAARAAVPTLTARSSPEVLPA